MEQGSKGRDANHRTINLRGLVGPKEGVCPAGHQVITWEAKLLPRG